MISQTAIDALPVGKDVYDDLTYCLQQWQEANYKAAMAVPEPADDSSTVDWVISLVGNLIWAASVFFPPAFAVTTTGKVAYKLGVEIAEGSKVVYATASTATKAASVLGAVIGAGTVSQFRRLGGKLNSPQGKHFLSQYFGSQVPDLLKVYREEADTWIKKSLLNRMISQYSIRFHPDNSKDNDADFTRFYNSVAGAEERRRYVWEDFVFPDYRTPYDNKDLPENQKWPGGQLGLQNLVARYVATALKDFNVQWEVYQNMISYDAGRYRQIKQQYVGRVPPFHPILMYQGIPEAVQAKGRANAFKLKQMYDIREDPDTY
jgi:hypothetical protein